MNRLTLLCICVLTAAAVVIGGLGELTCMGYRGVRS